MAERVVCQNCKREIVNLAAVYMYTDNWVHVHSQQRECDRPNVAISMPTGRDTPEVPS